MSDTDVFAVLERKGMIQIIIEIGTYERKFEDINQGVLISKSTVNTRLKDGREAGLLEVSFKPSDHGTKKRHSLTKYGEIVLGLIQELNFEPTVREYQRVSRQFRQGRDNLILNLNKNKQLASLHSNQVADEPQTDDIPHKVHPDEFEKKPHEKIDFEDDFVGGLELPNDNQDHTSEEDSE